MFNVSLGRRVVAAIGATGLVSMLGIAPALGAVFPVGVSVGQNGTGFDEPGSFGNGPTALNDLRANPSSAVTSSTSSVSYAGVTYGLTPARFNHILVDMYPSYVISGFNVQVAYAPNPDPAIDADWTTVQSFSGLATNSGPGFNISIPETTGYGVRVVSTDKSTTAGYMRTSEVWVFNNYDDVAPLATLDAPGFASPSFLTDETGGDQAYAPLPETATLNWATPQNLGALLITGGAGNNTETLIDYTISINGSATPLITVTGNTEKTNYFLLPDPILTSSLTLNVTAADTGEGGYGRIGEIWAFAAVPEPTSLGLIAIGSLSLLRRSRAL